MATKKNSFITEELEWAEKQLLSWKGYVDANPFQNLKDRLDFKETKNGGMVKTVVASIEAQGKFLQETMKNYLALLQTVDQLRRTEEAKKAIRGDEDLSPMEGGMLDEED